MTDGEAEQCRGFRVGLVGSVVLGPKELLNTARYSLPDCEVLVGLIDSVAEVAPEMLPQLTPALVETCHCTVGAAQFAGVEAAPVKVAALGAVTVWLAGWIGSAGCRERGW